MPTVKVCTPLPQQHKYENIDTDTVLSFRKLQACKLFNTLEHVKWKSALHLFTAVFHKDCCFGFL